MASNSPDCVNNCAWIFFSFLILACVYNSEAMCPRACTCFQNRAWMCRNVTSLEDIAKSTHRSIKELTLFNLKDQEENNEYSRVLFESVRKLKIQNSSLSSLSKSFISAFPNVERVILVDNQFGCNDRVLPLQKWKSKVYDHGVTLHCSTPDGLAGTDLFTALETMARVNERCPVPCHCELLSLQNSNTIPNLLVNCSHQNLHIVPTSIPDVVSPIFFDLSFNQVNIIEVK